MNTAKLCHERPPEYWTMLSVNDTNRRFRDGLISQETYDKEMFFSDKLNFRESPWQAAYQKEYGFIGLVDKLNEYRATCNLKPLDSPYIEQKRREIREGRAS